ncbi:allergen Tha p 1-like [Plodia interpunctella]|uniref:allergen Tha p 1-like n=1 Tax=Plodia interpunctella TaxID=58824 RepID=UPI0023679F7C|nr:allergen Tha p 1-like [Plodia interpunctella]
MKSCIIFCLLALVAAAVARPSEHYTDRFDNVNLDEILANRRLLVPYVKCALDQAKCTPDGKELKSHIRDALENGCAKCTEPQREGTRKVIGHLINHEPDYWNQLTDKYDRDRKFTKQYETELRKFRH